MSFLCLGLQSWLQHSVGAHDKSPEIPLQTLGISCWPCHQTGRSGIDWGSHPPATLVEIPLYQLINSDWICSDTFLTEVLPQSPAEQLPQNQSHDLSSWIPGCTISPVIHSMISDFTGHLKPLFYDWEHRQKPTCALEPLTTPPRTL